MPTKTGKPRAGDRIHYRWVILGTLEAEWIGTVIAWPRYGLAKVRIDEVLYTGKYASHLTVGKTAEWDEYTSQMYLNYGTVKCLPKEVK